MVKLAKHKMPKKTAGNKKAERKALLAERTRNLEKAKAERDAKAAAAMDMDDDKAELTFEQKEAARAGRKKEAKKKHGWKRTPLGKQVTGRNGPRAISR